MTRAPPFASSDDDVSAPPQREERARADGEDDADAGKRRGSHGHAGPVDDETAVRGLQRDVERGVAGGPGAHVDRDASRLVGQRQRDVAVLVAQEFELFALQEEVDQDRIAGARA